MDTQYIVSNTKAHKRMYYTSTGKRIVNKCTHERNLVEHNRYIHVYTFKQWREKPTDKK